MQLSIYAWSGSAPTREVSTGRSRRCPARHRRRVEVVCYNLKRGPYRSLQGAVRQVNQWLRGEENRLPPEQLTEALVVETRPQIILSVRTRCSTRLKESEIPGRSLRDYIRLPVSEYSLLDPRWIELLDSKDASMFRITIPVEELIGIDTGEIVTDVHVRRNARMDCVVMKAKCVTLGRAELDQHLTVGARIVLHQSPKHGSWNPLSMRRFRLGINALIDDYAQQERLQANAADTTQQPLSDDPLSLQSFDAIQIQTDDPEPEKVTTNSNPAATRRKWVRLNIAVQLNLKIVIPPFLSSVPRVLLGSCGRIVARHVMNGVLRGFLKHVVSDYHAWASGAPRGSITQSSSLFALDDSDDDLSGGDDAFGQALRQ